MQTRVDALSPADGSAAGRVQRDKMHAKLLQYAQRVWHIDTGSDEEPIDAALAATRHVVDSLAAHGDIDLTVSRAILEAAL